MLRMYRIFTYGYHKFKPNAGKYTIPMEHLGYFFCSPQIVLPIPSIYGIGIFTNISHINEPYVGKYTIHGCYGLGKIFSAVPFGAFSHWKGMKPLKRQKLWPTGMAIRWEAGQRRNFGGAHGARFFFGGTWKWLENKKQDVDEWLVVKMCCYSRTVLYFHIIQHVSLNS